MKISRLLVLSALWLVGLGANATIVDGVRQAPEPATTAFQTGSADQVFYLYNTSAKLFFTQGNTWGTRACVGPYASAVKMYFSEATGDTAPEGAYLLNNYICIRSTSYSWKMACAEGAGTSLYADQGASWGRPFWTIIPTSGNGFRIQTTQTLDESGDGSALFMGRDDSVEQNFSNAYSGFTDDSQRYPVSAEIAEGEGHHIEWALVAQADYDAIADASAAYAKAQELKDVLDEAKSKSVDVAAEEAIYLNEAATIAELEAAITSAKQKINSAAESTATPENPVDMTNLIANPNGDDGNKNWSGTAPSMEYTVFETWNANFNTYQDIKGMPNGVYAIGVHGLYRAGATTAAYTAWQNGTDQNAFVYGKSGEDSVAVAVKPIFAGANAEKLGVGSEYGPDGTNADGQEMYVPNNRQAAQAYFQRENDPYQNTVLVGVENGELRIGIGKTVLIGNDWTPYDTWTLTYYGNSAAAFQMWFDEFKKSAKSYDGIEDVYTDSYLTNYKAMLAVATASTKAEVSKAIADIQAAADSLEANIQLWKDYAALIKKAQETIAKDEFDNDFLDDDLADWADQVGEENIASHALSNSELTAELAQYEAAMTEYTAHPNPGTDLTSTYLKNADFSTNNWTGWTREAASGGNVAVSSSCAEAWNNSAFDIYQVVDEVPQGVYEISVQGFYRYLRGNNAWNAYVAQESQYVKKGGAPVFVYLNDMTTPFVNVFDEPITDEGFYTATGDLAAYQNPDGAYFPNGMVDAATAFGAGMFTQTAYGLVKQGDKLRIGVKGSSNQGGDSWVIFDNFKLTYKGMDADVIRPLLEAEQAKLDALKAEVMGKDVYDEMTKVLSETEAIVAGTDGVAMFNQLSAIVDIYNKVRESITTFSPLNDDNEALKNEIVAYSTSSAKGEAEALYADIAAKLMNHEITTDEIETYRAQIKAMVTKLRTPNNAADATDEAPVDMTSVITNPTYDEGVAGWLGTAAAWNSDGALAEIFNKNYDYYQEFVGLPAGAYKVTVQAFYRASEAVRDYETVDSVQYSNGYLYASAINGTDTVTSSNHLARLASILAAADYPYKGYPESTLDGFVKVHTDTLDKDAELYQYDFVPNTMVTAGDQFLNGYFNNQVIVKLAEGQTLRIGLKKDSLLSNDWTIFDNWTLTYYGANSTKEADADAYALPVRSLEGTGATVKVEYFTLDGRQATGARRGLMIRKETLDNGQIIVKKIRK